MSPQSPDKDTITQRAEARPRYLLYLSVAKTPSPSYKLNALRIPLS